MANVNQHHNYVAQGGAYARRKPSRSQPTPEASPEPTYAPDPGYASGQVVFDAEAVARDKSPWNGQGVNPAAFDGMRAILKAEFERKAEEDAAEQERLDAMSTEELQAQLKGIPWHQG